MLTPLLVTILSERRVFILSGLSGSGKSTAASAFEDRGYFVVDNLPVVLLPQCLLLRKQESDSAPFVAVVDVRNREFLKSYTAILEQVGQQGYVLQSSFFEASEDCLLRRYSETRRRHPLRDCGNLHEAITLERQLLQPLRAGANRVVDTSGLTPHQLRELVWTSLEGQAPMPLKLQLLSFGYRNGIPREADLVFDVRFLPNPHYLPALRPLSGLDASLRDYVLSQQDCKEFLSQLDQMLAFLLPRYIREGKSYLTIAIGCTGGRHRSVSLVEDLAQRIDNAQIQVRVSHRDLMQGPT